MFSVYYLQFYIIPNLLKDPVKWFNTFFIVYPSNEIVRMDTENKNFILRLKNITVKSI